MTWNRGFLDHNGRHAVEQYDESSWPNISSLEIATYNCPQPNKIQLSQICLRKNGRIRRCSVKREYLVDYRIPRSVLFKRYFTRADAPCSTRPVDFDLEFYKTLFETFNCGPLGSMLTTPHCFLAKNKEDSVGSRRVCDDW